MTLILVLTVTISLAALFAAIAALLLVPPDLVAEACRPSDPPPRHLPDRLPRRGNLREPGRRSAA